MSEESLQKGFIKYINLRYPKIRYCASLGGIRTSMKQAIKAKATGYVKGFPDVQILVPRGGFFGLFIELKLNKKSYPTKEQKAWIDDLNTAGYMAVVCKGYEEACNVLDSYMRKKLTTTLYREAHKRLMRYEESK